MQNPRYELLDHPSELGVAFQAASLPEVLAHAVGVFAHLVAPTTDVTPDRTLRVVAEAPEPAHLLVRWLSELVYALDGKRFLALHADDLRVWGPLAHEPPERRWRSEGVLHGVDIDVRGLALEREIKAVTYHLAEARPDERGLWRARIVFDV